MRSRSEVLVAVTMQGWTFWVVRVIARSSVTGRIFGDIYSFHFQARRETKQAKSRNKSQAGFLLVLFFDPEDGGFIFFLNVGLSSNYTSLELIRAQSKNNIYFLFVVYITALLVVKILWSRLAA
jgi:hypothetical protein